MKIPISDQFLWDLYKIFETTENIIGDVFPVLYRDIGYSEIKKLRKIYNNRKGRKKFSKIIYYLKKQGYIKVKNLKSKKAILLTRKGVEKSLRIKLKMTEKKRRKDGKWIMIIFDIPERKRELRALLRETLYLLEYKMFQQSVWICPCDVLKETENFIQRNLLDRYVKLFLIEEIEIDKE